MTIAAELPRVKPGDIACKTCAAQIGSDCRDLARYGDYFPMTIFHAQRIDDAQRLTGIVRRSHARHAETAA